MTPTTQHSQAAAAVHPRQSQRPAGCQDGWCSVGLMRSFCPSCMIAGLVMLPLEAAWRGLVRLWGRIRR